MHIEEPKQEEKFISLMNDATFKTLWNLEDPNIRRFLVRIVSRIVGYDISKFSLSTNELPITNYQSIANRVDILLENKNRLIKINIELNANYSKTLENKNDSYIYKIAGDFYRTINEKKTKEKYSHDINIEQINLNGYSDRRIKGNIKSDFYLMDGKNKVIRKGIKIHDLFLPEIKKLCYNMDKEANNDLPIEDLAMFACTSYEEMERIAKGDKEREYVMGKVRLMSKDEEFVLSYDRAEFEACLKAELKERALDEARTKGREEGLEEGRKEGREEGHVSGIVEGKSQIISLLLSKGNTKKEVSAMLDIPLQEIEKLLNISRKK